MTYRRLPPMPVEFYPNTGMEAGWCIALERELERDGWAVWPEVVTGPRRFVDMIAQMGGIVLVIEVKQIARPAAVDQLRAYLSDVQAEYPLAVGILAAPSITGTVRDMPDDMAFLPLVRV